ncbi:uncharacterized protein LOC106643117 [Copidosoma floridanum]|uniref:uncharacterized protein LOC106643117 n=1 Tax=Copidosoma floridanum TaxID=29053 RepID=UPI0006C9872A|nr:uncharacterized protein LOC106643117 [Copidosoma floridanum]
MALVQQLLLKGHIKGTNSMEYLQTLSVLRGKKKDNSSETIPSMFNAVAKNNPQKIALLSEDAHSIQNIISYELMNEKSDCIAQVLRQCYLKDIFKESIIGVALKSSKNLPIILLGIMKAGMAYLPIDLEFPADRIIYILKDAKPTLCIVEETANLGIFKGTKTVFDTELILKLEEKTNEKIVIRENTNGLAVVLYTSGSTGTPKGLYIK